MSPSAQLQGHNITPVFVFDGAPLPAKAQENAARSRSRADWKLKAKNLLQERQEEQDGRAVFLACADAQLAFLSRHKHVDVVISDDLDCVPYGVKTVLFKLTLNEWCSELKRKSLGANEELSFVGWIEEMFILFCVLAGCDYCPSVRGVGIFTAFKLVNQYKTPKEVLEALQQQRESLVPEDFAKHFYSAILTYRHQLVFDPRDMKLKMLCPLGISKDILQRVDKGLSFLGNLELRDDIVASIASGHIHPVTHESYAWKDTAAAVLLETEVVANHKRSTRSLTSFEAVE
ncbi:unnamed protein product [Peronospora effusa]|nr:unnamed protein product [Peronospora effusa]